MEVWNEPEPKGMYISIGRLFDVEFPVGLAGRHPPKRPSRKIVVHQVNTIVRLPGRKF